MKYLKYAWEWLITSSADPYKVSLSVKGFLVTVSSFIVPVIVLLGHQVDNEQIQGVVDATAIVVQSFLALVGAIVFLVGLVRKLWRTFTGNNVGMSR